MNTKSKLQDISISIVGDCSDWNLYDFNEESYIKTVEKYVKPCDLFIFNLEGVIINEAIKPEGVINNRLLKFVLKLLRKLQPNVTSSKHLLTLLNIGKENVACLANNHMLDAGRNGIKYTIGILKQRNFKYLGAGLDNNEASKYLIIDIRGKKIGILNYNFIGWRRFGFFIDIFGAKKGKYGVNTGTRPKIKKDLKNISKEADFVILVSHIGRVGRNCLPTRLVNFLESFKADLVIVNHAHLAQETKSNNVISLGDFIFIGPEKRKSNILNIKDGKIKLIQGYIKDGMFRVY